MIRAIKQKYEFGENISLDFGGVEIPAFTVDSYHQNDEDPYILLVIDDPDYGDPFALIKIYKDRTIIEVDTTECSKFLSDISVTVIKETK